MTDLMHNSEPTGGSRLDDHLDAALARYTTVEPRAGLEDRILAHLNAERRRPAGVAWCQWTGVAATAIAIVIVALLVWRAGKPLRDRAVHHSPRPQQEIKQPIVVKNSETTPSGTEPRRNQRPRRHAARTPVLVATEPKLDQFPSPQPLTEAERMLADYVGRYHDEAVLIARAREEQLQRDRMEEDAQGLQPSDWHSNSK